MKKKGKRKSPESYVDRNYRALAFGADLVSTRVRIEETDLHIMTEHDVTAQAITLVMQYRSQLENYIVKNPLFSATLDPLAEEKFAPPLVRAMQRAGIAAGVGPMAAVAGTIAEYVGRDLLASGCREVIVENGGDIFVKRERDCSIAVFAGESPLSYRVGIRLQADMMPMGVCTSSGTVGHSLSLGDADSVTVLSKSTPVADAAATRLGNEFGKGKDRKAGMARVLERSREIELVEGVLVIHGRMMGASGNVELVNIDLDNGSKR